MGVWHGVSASAPIHIPEWNETRCRKYWKESVLSLNRPATGNRSPSCGPPDIFRITDGFPIARVIGQSPFKR